MRDRVSSEPADAGPGRRPLGRPAGAGVPALLSAAGAQGASLGPDERGALAAEAQAAIGNRRLARAIAGRSNRAAVMRSGGYGYGYADDPLVAGGFGPDDATIRVRPAPVRTTIIGERAEATQAPQQTTTTEPPAASAPAAVPEEALTPVRQMILAEVKKWEGAREGTDDPRFGQIFGGTALDTARKEAASDVYLSGEKKGQAKKPSVHTTCIDFQTIVWARVREQMAKAGLGTMKKIVTPMNAPSLGEAWVKAEPGMPKDRRPKRGDFYVLWSTKAGPGGKVEPKQFSHVAYFTGRTVQPDGSEVWTSVDGGQGTAADISPKGVVNRKGAEAILACTRTYFPDSNLMAGGVANQPEGGRWLLGWIDVDKLVTPAPAKP